MIEDIEEQKIILLITVLSTIGFAVFTVFGLFLYIYIGLPDEIEDIKNYLKRKYGKWK